MAAMENTGIAPKITPFLWFDDKAEEAANFYVSIFKNSGIVSISHYGEAGPKPKGTVLNSNIQARGPGIHSAEWRTKLQIH